MATTNGNKLATNGANKGEQLSPEQWKQIAYAMDRLVGNAVSSRAELVKRLLDPRRDINRECGFPETSAISAEDYQQMYDREAVAGRVVDFFAKESWKKSPTVFEIEDADEPTPFEEAWDALGSQLRGEKSYFREEKGSRVWTYLKMADELSGIGHYGGIFIAIDDGLPLHFPANGIPTGDSRGIGGTEEQYYDYLNQVQARQLKPYGGERRKILFLRAISEAMVETSILESNIHNPRFNQPIMYRISFQDPNVRQTGVGVALSTYNVHWTRFLHIADIWHQPSSNEIMSVPRMRPVYNLLLGLRKLYSGSPEMYWQGAFPGYSVETHPQIGAEIEVDDASIKNAIENLVNGLTRWMRTTGMSVKSLAPQVVDPTPQINVLLDAIAIRTGIPIRILKGSERGQLASDQDQKELTGRVDERRQNYNTPCIVVPFVDRLIYLGVLPMPGASKVGEVDPSSSGIDPKEYPLSSAVSGIADSDSNRGSGARGKPYNQSMTYPFTFSSNIGGRIVANVIDRDNPYSCFLQKGGFGSPISPISPTTSLVSNKRRVEKVVKVWNEDVGRYEMQKKGFTILETESGYSISWPDLTSRSEDERARTLLQRTQAMAAYVNGNLEMMMSKMDFYTREMGYTEEEAEAIIEGVETAMMEQYAGTSMDVFGDGTSSGFDDEGGGNPFDKKDTNPFGTDEEEDKPVGNVISDYELDYITFLVANCGGVGGKPGPCPKGTTDHDFREEKETTPSEHIGITAKAIQLAVGTVKDALAKMTMWHPTAITPSASANQALTALFNELSGNRPVSMAAASVVLGIAPTALVQARRGLRLLSKMVEEEKQSGSSGGVKGKENKQQRTARQHKQRKEGRPVRNEEK